MRVQLESQKGNGLVSSNERVSTRLCVSCLQRVQSIRGASGLDLQRGVTSSQIPDSVQVKQVLPVRHSGRRQHDIPGSEEEPCRQHINFPLLPVRQTLGRPVCFVCGSR